MATSVATPLERRLGTIAGVNEITSSSRIGSARVTLQFDLSRNIDGAAREVQAAINASARRPAGDAAQQPDLSQGQPGRRAGDHPGADLEDAARRGRSTTRSPTSSASACRRSTASATSRSAAARCRRCASSCCRSRCNRYGISTEDVRAAIQASNANRPKGAIAGRRPAPADLHPDAGAEGERLRADGGRLAQRRRGAPARRRRGRSTASRTRARSACSTASRRSSSWSRASRRPTSSQTVDAVRALLPELQAELPADVTLQVASDRTNSIRASLREVEITLMISVVLVVLVVSAVPAQPARDHRAGGGHGGRRCSAPSA